VQTRNVFADLTPDIVISAVEKAVGKRMTGLILPLPSYINRVYELQAMDGTRLIAKFYRPGRWSEEAIEAEHAFIADCVADEIPVIAPLPLQSGATLAQTHGITFAVFPKRMGREFEVKGDDDWRRVGMVIGRIHAAGARKEAPARIKLHPRESTAQDIRLLEDGGFVHPDFRAPFRETTSAILEVITGLYEGIGLSRIHGDCHRGNLIDRPGEGIMVIDFDDMMVGPPVHDLWLMLPDHYSRSRREMDLILEGYEEFREFDYASLRLIEGLRFMRIIYYLAWCARQVDDYEFQRNHPDWGGEVFWGREIADMQHQFQVIMEHKHAWELEH